MFDGKFSFFCFLEKNQNKACLSNFKSAMETKLVLLFRPIYIIQNSNTKIIYWLKKKKEKAIRIPEKKTWSDLYQLAKWAQNAFEWDLFCFSNLLQKAVRLPFLGGQVPVELL